MLVHDKVVSVVAAYLCPKCNVITSISAVYYDNARSNFNVLIDGHNYIKSGQRK